MLSCIPNVADVNTAGGVYSCPDMFVLPNSDTYVFASLSGSYWLGKYDSVAKGAASPTFAGPTRTPADAVPLAGQPNGTFAGLGIWKTGGSGPSNAVNASSRRLFFGTLPSIV